MTARIDTFRQAVAASIKAMAPELRSCEAQFGRLNLDEFEKQMIGTPGVRVAVLSADAPNMADGRKEAVLSCAAFAVCEGRDREQAAWALAEAIAVHLHSAQQFGLVQIAAPTAVKLQPVLTATIMNRAVAIIAVEWKQTLRGLGSALFDEEGVLLTEFYLNDEEIELPEPQPPEGDDG